MRKCAQLLVCLVIGMILSANTAFALDSSNSAEARKLQKENLKIEKQGMKADVMEIKKASREAMMEDKAERKEAISLRRAEFKEQLKEIKDMNKQALVDKIDMRLATINSTQTQKWTEDLNKLQTILNRISTEAATLQGTAGITSPLDQSITSASTAITTAQTAVAAQAAKEYVITITTEAALRSNVGTTVSQFKLDLQSTRQKVQAAHQAVMKAATELRKAKNEGAGNSASDAAFMTQ